ncbi:mutator-like element, partial [Fusarium austroafricanum]
MGVAVVQEQHPESTFTQRDIYNARAIINQDKLNGYTPTAALIKLFDEMDIWKRFPEVISFNNTYNTNRFKLLLFQAIGQTCLGSVFNAAFGLIDNKRREGFQFLSESIQQLAEQHSICQPDVIITDFDDQIKAALNDQFPNIQQQLYIHYINSNVLLKSKQKEFNNQQAILRYLHGTYMPIRAQWARCFIRKYRNFSIRITSSTEASNNNIKSYLLNGMSHLYQLVKAMQDMMKDQERDFNDACAADEVLTAREYIGSSSEYLGELQTAISLKGLGLINKQYRLARKAMPTGKNPFLEPLGGCNDDCSVSVELGIPYCHKVYSRLGSATPFTKWEVHPRWRLREPSSRDPYRRILDPKIATALHGRPKNTTQAVPARLAIRASNQQSNQLASQGPSRRRQGQLPGSLNRSTLARVELDASQHASSQASSSNQRQKRSQSGILRAGRTTGGRASGRKTQPSIRRRRSQWELLNSDEEILPSIVAGLVRLLLQRSRLIKRAGFTAFSQ